jgi:hypothetical protein
MIPGVLAAGACGPKAGPTGQGDIMQAGAKIKDASGH